MTSNASKKVEIYGLVFNSMADLCRLLGYTSSLSKSFVLKQYGSLEQLIKVRLRVDNDEQAKAKLLELLEQKDDKKIQNVSNLETKEQKCAKAYINALINKGDEGVLDALCLAFDCQKDKVLKAVDSLKTTY